MDTPTAAPVKVVLELRAKDADRAALEAWVRDLLDTATRTAALQGSSVLTDGGRFFVLLRFATQADHDRWSASPEFAALMKRGEGFVAREQPLARTGLETWFTLPGTGGAAKVPAKWKMALVTWCALLPQIVVLSFIVPKTLPFLLNVAVSTAIPVCVLTWLAMPHLTRLLARWLYGAEVPR